MTRLSLMRRRLKPLPLSAEGGWEGVLVLSAPEPPLPTPPLRAGEGVRNASSVWSTT